jgi:hypothetical protein
MKKKYVKPQTETIILRSPVVMLESSSVGVNNYSNGGDINIGDSDE